MASPPAHPLHWAVWVLILCSLGATPKEAPTPGPAPSRPGREFSTYKLISDRNIFNANRSSRSGANSGESRKPKQVDTLSLVGTMSYEKGPFAFFDGSSSEFRKVLEPGKSIAGFTLSEVTGSGVKLQMGTNLVELRVGMKMTREEEGEWQAAAPPPGMASPSPDSSTSSSDDEDEIVKKLMQQREQELK